jgi:hypothetical protein
MNTNAKENREEQKLSLQTFSEIFSKNVKDFNDLQKQKFEEMAGKQDDLVRSTELKLEKMRETVDEKLHKSTSELNIEKQTEERPSGKILEDISTQEIQAEQLDIFAQPLPLDSELRNMDINNPESYTFAFEIGLKPAVDIDVENCLVAPQQWRCHRPMTSN